MSAQRFGHPDIYPLCGLCFFDIANSVTKIKKPHLAVNICE